MSTRWDPASDRAAATGSLPNPASGFTLCAWIRPLTDPDDFQAFIRLAGSGGSSTSATLGTTGDGTTLAYVSPGGVVPSPHSVVPGEWTFAALRNGVAAGDGEVIGAAAFGAFASNVNEVSGAAPDTITLGGRSPADASESFGVDLAHVRLFSARLTDAELDAERRSTEPVHASCVHAWPVLTGGDLADTVGTLDLTAGATATATATGPPVGDGAAVALDMTASAEGFAPGDPAGDGAADPLNLGAAAAGHKLAAAAAPAPALDLSTTGSGLKLSAATVSGTPLDMGATATGERGSEGGDPDVASAVSEVLCSPWATIADVPEAVLEGLPESITDAMVDEALLRASEILWALSGRQWLGGGCEETATLRSLPAPAGTGMWPYDRSWGRCPCWGYGGWSLEGGLPLRLYPFPGSHQALVAVRLPRRDAQVETVTVDGEAFSEWTQTVSGWLERTDGGAWDLCDGSTEVAYTFGNPPPGGGRDSAIELGIELLKYRNQLDGCRLPRRATQITRQGVSITIDPMTFLAEGGTGLLYTDMWLRSVNPDRRPAESMVWSPDVPRLTRS